MWTSIKIIIDKPCIVHKQNKFEKFCIIISISGMKISEVKPQNYNVQKDDFSI